MTDHTEQQKQNPKKSYHFFVDGNKYETDLVSISGAQVKTIAGTTMAYQLFLEEDGDAPDRAISDPETVNLDHGTKHFYAVPPATFGIV